MPLAPFISKQLTRSLGGMRKHTNTLTHWCFSRGVLQVSKPVAADGHSWEGLVSLGDRHNRSICVLVFLCAHVFVKISVHDFMLPPSPSHLSPPHLYDFILTSLHSVNFMPWRMCKCVTHCLSPHRLCQQLFNDGCRSQAKLCQQLTGCLSARAVRLEHGLSFTYNSAYSLKG